MGTGNISKLEFSILAGVVNIENLAFISREFTGAGWYLYGTISSKLSKKVFPLSALDFSNQFGELTILMPTLFIADNGKEFGLQVSVSNEKNKFEEEDYKKIALVQNIIDFIVPGE